MQTLVFPQYGPPSILKLEEIAKPIPKDQEVLIKVVAVSVNPADWHIMRADPWFVRFATGLFKPRVNTLGADVAGIVESVGKEVKLFQPGDEVFGELSTGSFAEYAIGTEEQLAMKPTNLSFAEAASVGIAGLTALQGLRDLGQIQSGQQVLINGASGGVGTYAVQIAKSYGATVTGVCSTRNLQLVRSIGADHVIDYTREDFTRSGRTYDLLYDAVGNVGLAGYKRSLQASGRGVMIGFSTMGHMIKLMAGAAWTALISNRKIGSMTAKAKHKDLSALAELLASAKIIPVLDRQYEGLAKIPEAIAYLEEGHAKGKVVVTI